MGLTSAEWTELFDQFWRMQTLMPGFLFSLSFFVPLVVLPAGAAAGLIGALIFATRRLYLFAFIIPLEVANAAAAWSAFRFVSYFDDRLAAGAVGLALVVALGVAITVNRVQWFAAGLMSVMVLCYAGAVAMYGAIQHLQ